MIGFGARLPRIARISHYFSLLRPPPPLPPPPFRFFCSDNNRTFAPNAVVVQMISYALSLARSQKSDESYGKGFLVLEQCFSTQSDENSKGIVLLAMSTLLSERGNFTEAIDKLQSIPELSLSSIAVRVAATEALVGLNLELDEDDSSSVLEEICFQLLEGIKSEIGGRNGFEVLEARAKALKGLLELVCGNLESAESFFAGDQSDEVCSGNVALSYAEYLHGMRKFSIAKGLYQKVIEGTSDVKDFNNLHTLAACNMSKDEVLLAATCGLGQLEAHLGNFGDAEEILTAALKKAEDHFGAHHPKVGVILTCIALMFRLKATIEHSSSLLIQEGLYRRAIELLKAPALGTEEVKVHRKDIVALARGGYAETLCLQQNRKAEGERMKHWAETVWKNRRLSLSEALELSETSSKIPVIDSRICRAL